MSLSKFKDNPVLIANGIDTDLYISRNDSANETGDIIICMVARFHPTKDQKTLLRAFGLLVAELSSQPIQLVLAGDGETMLELENLCVELNLTHKVCFPGMLNEAEIVGLLSRSAIYVHATHSETMSTSIMQAMSCGLPVIASDIPGVKNLVNGKNGWLYPPGNEMALKNSIFSLVNQKQLRQDLGKAAHNYAIKNFSNRTMFEKYDGVISGLCTTKA